jgi:hypothetical protein
VSHPPGTIATLTSVLLLTLVGHLAPAPVPADDLADARRLLREAKEVAAASFYDVFVTIAGVQAAAGDLTAALETAAGLDERERRPWALQAIAVAQAASGDLAGALQTANVRQQARWQDVTLHEIAIVRAKSGDVPGALQVITALPDPQRDTLGRFLPLRVEALLVVLSEQARRGDVRAARLTADQIPEPHRSLLAAATIAAGQAPSERPGGWQVRASENRFWPRWPSRGRQLATSLRPGHGLR